MANFKRARSDEQKEQRMNEIKKAAAEMFQDQPYHEITLTTIANKLNITRANLYQYVSTKEEIFLELCADKRDEYYEALKTAFPKDCGYSIPVIAEVWAGLLNAHQEHLHYCDILSTIIETNVSIDRLAAFKKNYYLNAYEVCDRIGSLLNLDRDTAYQIFLNVHYHAVGFHSICRWNPLIEKALEKEKISTPHTDFLKNIKDFILMNLYNYTK